VVAEAVAVAVTDKMVEVAVVLDIMQHQLQPLLLILDCRL
jgi:hypothetical protein